MIKLIIFDLDGVLVESKDTHFNALNRALREVSEKYIISKEEHIKEYDGLPTMRKLNKLTENKGLSKEKHDFIWKRKQECTIDLIYESIMPDNRLIDLFEHLYNRKNPLKIYIASNSIRRTVIGYLTQLGLMKYIDGFISNEDVMLPKPHPEMYWKIMTQEKVFPHETVIIEDSQVGIVAAMNSNANVIRVKNPSEVTYDLLSRYVEEHSREHINRIKWEGNKMNILVPMAGAGSRFEKMGYTFPKPLIDIKGKPMIQAVIENVNINANYIYIVQKEHYERYNLKYLLNMITPNCTIIQIDYITEGAACTTLLAKDYIDNEESLLIINSDQFIIYNSVDFMYYCESGNLDGCVMTFCNNHPKWSYVKLDKSEKYIVEVAEKKVISNEATVGFYYYRRGSDYVKYAERMISKNIRTNNEFYVAPVINEALLDGNKFGIYHIDEMWGVGTPEDLNYFINNYKGDL